MIWKVMVSLLVFAAVTVWWFNAQHELRLAQLSDPNSAIYPAGPLPKELEQYARTLRGRDSALYYPDDSDAEACLVGGKRCEELYLQRPEICLAAESCADQGIRALKLRQQNEALRPRR